MQKGAVDLQYGEAPQGVPGVGSWGVAESLMGVDQLEEGWKEGERECSRCGLRWNCWKEIILCGGFKRK